MEHVFRRALENDFQYILHLIDLKVDHQTLGALSEACVKRMLEFYKVTPKKQNPQEPLDKCLLIDLD